MKFFMVLLFVFIVWTLNIMAIDPRSDMIVRYYENKPIVEERKPLDLLKASVHWEKNHWVSLDGNGLHVSKNLSILDTFSLTYNPKRKYIMLDRQAIRYPSEELLLVRSKSTVYIIDLYKELKVGEFSLNNYQEQYYIELIKDENDNTSLKVNKSNTKRKAILIKYKNNTFISYK